MKRTLVLLLLLFQTATPFSLIYNMKVRRSLAAASLVSHPEPGTLDLNVIPIFAHEKLSLTAQNSYEKDPSVVIDVHQKRYNLGTLLNANYRPLKNWWCEIGTEIAHESYKNKGTSSIHKSRTGLDDILITSGYEYTYKKKAGITFYGLAGFPTLRKLNRSDLYGPVLGTRLFSNGAGLEFSYLPYKSPDNTVLILFQSRCIHFYNRPWNPVYHNNNSIHPGNVTDLLWAVNYKHKKTVYETGYNITFHTNQALETPQKIVPGNSYTYNGIYGIISQKIESAQPVLCSGGGILAKSHYLNALRYSVFLSFATAF